MKAKIGVTLLIIFLVFSTVSSWVLLVKERKNSSRLESDIRYGYQSGFKISEYYKAKNGQLVARNSVLELTNKEIRNGIAQDVLTQLDNLGIKPKFITNYSETVVQHDQNIITKVHDSVIFDTIHAECFNYTDKWNTISGCKIGGEEHVKVSSTDSICQVIYRGSRYNKKGHKMPGLFFWLSRRLDQVITSNNPSSKIVYSKTISVTK